VCQPAKSSLDKSNPNETTITNKPIYKEHETNTNDSVNNSSCPVDHSNEYNKNHDNFNFNLNLNYNDNNYA